MNMEEVVEKIKKAVRLADKTASEAERETALRLARNLAEKNGIAFEDVAEDTDSAPDKAVSEDDADFRTLPGSEFGLACFIVKTHFGVIIMQTARRSTPWKARLSWIGSRLNIDVARYVYAILIRESRRAWREAKKEAGPRAGKELDRLSFMRGFFFALHKKLAEHPLRNDLDSSIRAAERRLLSFAQESEKGIRMAKGGGGVVKDVDALAAGYNAGSAVNLARPCEGKNGAEAAIGNVPLLAAM